MGKPLHAGCHVDSRKEKEKKSGGESDMVDTPTNTLILCAVV